MSKENGFALMLIFLVLGSGCLGDGGDNFDRGFKTVPWVPDGRIDPGEYAVREDFNGMSVYLRAENGTLYVGISSETHGWVAIGFGGASGMKNTDIVIAYVLPNGTVVVSDSYSAGFSGPHNPDTFLGGRDDITSYGGRENENGTVVEFSRPLKTGDEYDYPIPPGKPFRVVWAYGPADDFQSMHIKVGYVYITLEGEG